MSEITEVKFYLYTLDNPVVRGVLQAPTGDGAAVRVFTGQEFTGSSQDLTSGRYDAPDLAVGEDSISSVLVPEGWRVTLFENTGFTGKSAVIESSAESLGADIDDTVSSLIVERI